MKIYLDDVRMPYDGWWLVKVPSEVIRLLDAGIVQKLSLDHDLGDDENIGTGYDVLLWLEEQVFNDYRIDIIPDEIKVHSANVAVRDKMEQAITKIMSAKI